MSLEFYTRNGHYLPIGLAVCALCRDKHLKSVDLSNSRLIQNDCVELVLPDSNTSPMAFEAAPSVFIPPPVAASNHAHKREAVSPPRSLLKKRTLSTSNVTSTNGEVTTPKVKAAAPHSFSKGNDNFGKVAWPSYSTFRPSRTSQDCSTCIIIFISAEWHCKWQHFRQNRQPKRGITSNKSKISADWILHHLHGFLLTWSFTRCNFSHGGRDLHCPLSYR